MYMKNFKALLLFIIVIIMLAALICISGCKNSASDIAAIISGERYVPELPEERKHLRIGVLEGPYADMVKQIIEPALISMDYTSEMVFFTEWDATNLALAGGKIDLNLFQHNFFLNNSKTEYNIELSAIAEIPTASMVLLSERFDSLGDIEHGASIALPRDATNLARALRVLREAGLISLNYATDISRVTLNDVVGNPLGLSFNLVDGFGLYQEQILGSDAVVMTGAQAYAGGVNLAEALYSEILRDGFMIVATVRTEDLARRYVHDLLAIIYSDGFKNAVTAADSPFSGFQRPHYFFD